MGMFDYVNFKAPCKKCGKELTNFQTKDLECELVVVEPEKCERFYDSCPDCKTWNEYEVIKPCFRLLDSR
jgi:phage FluMu protein Com